MIGDGFGYQSGTIGEFHAWVNSFAIFATAFAVLVLQIINQRPRNWRRITRRRKK